MKRIFTSLFAVMAVGQAWAATTFTVNGLKYTVTDEENHYVSVAKGSTILTDALEIPSQVTYPETDGETYTVASLAYNAFYDCRGLTSVTIPNSVTSIGEHAFEGCINLTSINIQDGVTSIGAYAFVGCCKLTTIKIPKSVIEFRAGNNEILPEGRGEDLYAFMSCNMLESIEVEDGNAFYSSIDGILYNKDKTTVIRCPEGKKGKCTIPDGVTNIGNQAFINCNKITSINIPEGVTNIGDYAFGSCTGLTSIIVPNSVTYIGYHVLFGCSSLQSITLPFVGNQVCTANDHCFPFGYVFGRSVYNGGMVTKQTYGSSRYTETDFYYIPASLKEVVITGDNYIPCGAFSNCNGLTSVTIASGASIGFGAFTGCSSLQSITLPLIFEGDNEHNISTCSYTLGYIFGTTRYDGSNPITQNYYANPFSNVASVTTTYYIPASLRKIVIVGNNDIRSGTFYDCSRLTTITIPESITNIGSYAFYGCSGLTSICCEGSSQPTYQSNSFTNVGKTIPVCVSAEYSSSKWCGFTNLIIGHNRVTDAAVAATCTETGLTEGSHCSYCGKIFVAQQEIDAVGHNYGVPTYEWTEDGSACTATSICQRDETHVATEDATITSEVTMTATCLEMGTTTYTATFENELFAPQTKDVVDVPTIAHSYSTTVTAPTCTNVGYATHTCLVCEYSYNTDTVSANGHTADCIVFENPVAATCTVAGSRDSVVYCSVCRDELFREKKEIPTIAHSYITSITAPTCTEVGYTTHVCSVCNHTYNSDTVAANGHTEVVDAAVAATCTTAGKTEGKHCSVCNEVIVAQTEVAALGHDFGEYVYNNDATIDADGTKTATCSRCGEKDTQVAEGTKLVRIPENDGTAVSESAANEINIYAHGNRIVVENATEEICVFDAMGRIICKDATHCVRAEIPVTATGVYIVKTGSVVKRVVVN
jgi:hypothetical protein